MSLQVNKIKAQKVHECDGCSCKINRRENYFKVVTFVSGNFAQSRMCEPCKNVVKLIFERGDEANYTPLKPGDYLKALRGYDEIACDVADIYRLPIDYVSRFIK